MGVLEKKKREKEPIESTGRVLAKNPLNVKLGTEESLRTQECKSQGKFMYLKKVRVCCLYSSGDLT